MLNVSRLLAQKGAQNGLSGHLKSAVAEVRMPTSEALSSLWSSIQRSKATVISTIRRYTSSVAPISAPSRTLSREQPRNFNSSKSTHSFTQGLSSRRIASSIPSTHSLMSQKRFYQANWNFRSAYQSMGGSRNLFSLRRPLGLIIAANIGVYLMWCTVGVTKDGHKWMTEKFMVSVTTYKEHSASLLGAAFSHQGLLHLGFNMVAIGTIGASLQAVMGPLGFLALTFASALTSSAAHLIYTGRQKPVDWQPRSQVIPLYVLPDGTPILESQIEAYRRVHGQDVAVRKVYGLSSEDHVWAPGLGASGIASAYFGFSTVLWPRRQFTVIFWSTHASKLMTLFVGFSTISMLFFPDSNIGHAAHMGGLAIGVAAALLTRGRAIRM